MAPSKSKSKKDDRYKRSREAKSKPLLPPKEETPNTPPPMEMDDLMKAFGSYDGPEAMFIKLISSDGHEFVVKREHAKVSETIKSMLACPGQLAEHEANKITFKNIPSHIMHKVCMFFTYKFRFAASSADLPEFLIPPEIAVDLLSAANFLDC